MDTKENQGHRNHLDKEKGNQGNETKPTPDQVPPEVDGKSIAEAQDPSKLSDI